MNQPFLSSLCSPILSMYWVGSFLNGFEKQWAADKAHWVLRRVAPQYITVGVLTLTTAIIQGHLPNTASLPPMINKLVDASLLFETPQPLALMLVSILMHFRTVQEQFELATCSTSSTSYSPAPQTTFSDGHKLEQVMEELPLQIQTLVQFFSM